MAKEIERKFLAINDSWKSQIIRPEEITQFYIRHIAGRAGWDIRVRMAGGLYEGGCRKAFFAIKQNEAKVDRDEFEYESPCNAAALMPAKFNDGMIVAKSAALPGIHATANIGGDR